MSTAPVATRPSATKVWTILGALYFVWGSTYLGIEKVNETMPTLLGAAIRYLDATISIKLSSLGALFDGDLALERTFDLCQDASRDGVGFEIDMEGRDLVVPAIEAASFCRRKSLPVTLALQAYLYRTLGDLRLLLAQGVVPRFVKGAYLRDVEDFSEIRKRFLALVNPAAGFEVIFHVGTHDPVLIPEIRSLMDNHRDQVTFGFLGASRPDQRGDGG